MTGFNHTLAGCIIAAIVPVPLAPFAALASHYALDGLPHFGRDETFVPYNRNFVMLLVLDGVLCCAALGFSIRLFPHLWWLMIICSATSTLPDFMWMLRGKVRWLQGYFRFAGSIQWGERPWGWMLESIYGVIFTAILIALR